MNRKQQLERRVDDVQHQMAQDKERRKPKPNENMLDEAEIVRRNWKFWCWICQEDIVADGYRTMYYAAGGDPIGVWRGTCPWCGTELFRHITHRDEDKYYCQSDEINRMRNQYATDVLQGEEDGFKTK